MSKSPNCTGAPLCKGQVDVSITYPSPDETLLDTPIDLPTSEPAEAQISYILGSQHMPTWSPYELEHVKSAMLYATGKNTSASAVTVYYRILKNGINVATGSRSVAAGSFYTWFHYNFFDVKAGDVLSCKLWTNAAGCNWDGKAVLVFPTRIGPKGQVLLNLEIPTVGLVYTLTIAGAGGESWFYLYPFRNSDSCYVRWPQGAIAGAIQTHEQFGLGRVTHSDLSLGSSVQVSTTRAPWYANAVPSRIVYTPLNLRV